MGRYVLGILAVAILQIAFGIYNRYQTPAELAAANLPTKVETRPPVIAKTPSVTDENAPSSYSNPVDIDSNTMAAAPRQANVIERHPRPARAAASERPARMRPHADRALVERQYFGRWVVERSFAPAKVGSDRTSRNVRRQVFGRMVVERTFGV